MNTLVRETQQRDEPAVQMPDKETTEQGESGAGSEEPTDRGWKLVTKGKSVGSRLIEEARERNELSLPRSGMPYLCLPLTDLTRGRRLDASGNVRSTRLSGVSTSRGENIDKVVAKHNHYNQKNQVK